MLTVIDVESRWVLCQFIDWKINKNDVQYLFDKIFSFYDLPKVVYVRNDNGSQFVASEVRDYLKDKDVIQEVTKPSTPEQNAHIESYNSIMESVICQKYQFESLDEAHLTFKRWIKFYNFEKLHSGIQYLSPVDYLNTKGINMVWNEEMEYTLNSMPDIILT